MAAWTGGRMREGLAYRSSMMVEGISAAEVKTLIDLRGNHFPRPIIDTTQRVIRSDWIPTTVGMRVMGAIGWGTAIPALLSGDGRARLQRATFEQLGMPKLYRILLEQSGVRIVDTVRIFVNPVRP